MTPAGLSLTSAVRVWQRNLWVYRDRWLYALLPNFFEPLFYLLGMGIGLGFYVTGGGDFGGSYLAFIGTGLIASSAMNGATFEVTYNTFIKLHFDKVYDAMIATRISMQDVALGELIWAVTRALAYGLIFMFITFFFDVPFTWNVLLAIPAIALTGFCFAAIGLAFTSVIPIIDAYSYYFTLFITPLFLFSDIFFPIADRFPAALVAVAQFTPLYQAVRLIRGILLGNMSGTAAHALYLLLVGTVFAAFAIWQMRRKVIH